LGKLTELLTETHEGCAPILPIIVARVLSHELLISFTSKAPVRKIARIASATRIAFHKLSQISIAVSMEATIVKRREIGWYRLWYSNRYRWPIAAVKNNVEDQDGPIEEEPRA
jgi:hypothetical protein